MLKNISLMIFIGLVGYSIYSMNNQKNVQPVRQQAKSPPTMKQACVVFADLAKNIAIDRDNGIPISTMGAMVRKVQPNVRPEMRDQFKMIVKKIVLWVYIRQTGIPPHYVGTRLYLACMGGPQTFSFELNR